MLSHFPFLPLSLIDDPTDTEPILTFHCMTKRTDGPRLTKLVLASFPSITKKNHTSNFQNPVLRSRVYINFSRASCLYEWICCVQLHTGDADRRVKRCSVICVEKCAIVCLHTNYIIYYYTHIHTTTMQPSNPSRPHFSCYALALWWFRADSVSKPSIFWGSVVKRRVKTTLPLIYMNALWNWSTTAGATVLWMPTWHAQRWAHCRNMLKNETSEDMRIRKPFKMKHVWN